MSSLYILGIISVANTVAVDVTANIINIKVIFEDCAPYTDCMTEKNNTQVDNAKDIDVIIPMVNLTEYSIYSKTSGSLLK